MGFPETDGETVRSKIRVDGTALTSLENGRSFEAGALSTPSLHELREHELPSGGQLSVREVVADVQDLHREPANAGAFFQVASQFNLLEMVGPDRTPEEGVGIYEFDRTQGPACAIACAAGTIFRNWLVPLDGQRGQTTSRQIDCLADLGDALGGARWEMRNGYALSSADDLAAITERLAELTPAERDELMGALRIGVHHNTEVTLPHAGHLVTQAYCSALPVAYSPHSSEEWEPFARLVLDASYEAVLRAAAQNRVSTGNRTVFLTLLGGGAFGNPTPWIIDALSRALAIIDNVDLDVSIVSYGSPSPAVDSLVR